MRLPRIRLRHAILAVSAIVSACEPPDGAAISRCGSEFTGVLSRRTTCVFTISPLDSAGYAHYHEDRDFGSATAGKGAVAVNGRLSVLRGEARLEIVDDAGKTHTVTALAGSPAAFNLRIRTAVLSRFRGMKFDLRPAGATRSADSLRLEYEFVP